jgi:hypothetical protein
MREDAVGLLKDVQKLGMAYIFYRSRPKAVIMKIEEFKLLQELLDDYQDEMEAKKLSREKRGKGISLTEIVKKYA